MHFTCREELLSHKMDVCFTSRLQVTMKNTNLDDCVYIITYHECVLNKNWFHLVTLIYQGLKTTHVY